MLAPHLELGRDVEQAALEYYLLREPRARLIERNCRFRWGEIDLIFEEPRGGVMELVFVEVRARSGGGWLRGYETLGAGKRARLKRAIRAYLARDEVASRERTMRVDVLSWDAGVWTHLKNVWI